jgi:ABC-type uncharacterized transport system permease subunit
MSIDRAKSYEANASKCVRLAHNASDIHSKLTLLEMARAWLLLADRALKNSKICLVYEPPMPSLRELEREFLRG